MGNISKLTILLFVSVLSFFDSQGQGLLKNAKYIEFGCGFAYGWTMDRLSVPEGDYKPRTLFGRFSMDLLKKSRLEKVFPGRFLLVSEPQVSWVQLGAPASKNEYEFGLVTVLQYHYPIAKRWEVYIQGGSGVYYMSTYTEVQRQGFIFCNYFGMGVYYFLEDAKNHAIWAGFRARHMSNANIWMPNNGINSHQIVVGYSWFVNH